MNGTKWYKLNKSNELMQVFLEGQFDELEATLNKRVSNALVNIGEIVFGAVMAFLLDEKIVPLKNFWDSIPFFQSDSVSFVKTILSCTLIFWGVIGVSHCLVFIFTQIKARWKDRKATPSDAYRLEKIFYKSVLNNIVTGISLEKKAFELSRNQANTATQEQDADLFHIYLVESLFYFNETIYNIEKYNILEINNSSRENYTEFLDDINANAVIKILQICDSTLDRIIRQFKDETPEDNSKSIETAEHMRKFFNGYINSIKKQLGKQ